MTRACDQGNSVTARRLAPWIGLAGFLFALATLRTQTGPLPYPDSFHYADLGRQLARGEGFTTQMAYPYVVSWVRDAGLSAEPPWPNVTRFPLIAALYAPFFAVLGTSEWTVRLFGAVVHGTLTATTFLLATRSFGIAVGLLAAAAIAGDLGLRILAGAGLLDLPAALCLVLGALLLVPLAIAPPPGAPSWRGALLLGIVLGASFLLRFDLLAMTPAALLVLLASRGRGGLRLSGWLLLGAAVLPGLWMLHNLVTVGSAFVFLGFDRNVLAGPTRPDPYRAYAHREIWTVLRDQPEILTDKLANLTWAFDDWQLLFGWTGPAFLIATLVLVVRRHRAATLAAFVIATFAFRELIFILTHHEARFYVTYLPAMTVCVIGVGWMPVADLLARVARTPRTELAFGATLALAFAVVHPLLAARQAKWTFADGVRIVKQRTGGGQNRPAEPPGAVDTVIYDTIRQRTPRGTVFATPWPEALTWFCDRPSIALDVRVLARLLEDDVRIDALLYPTAHADGIERSLARQRLADRYVRVASTTRTTMWLRRDLVVSWIDRGPPGG